MPECVICGGTEFYVEAGFYFCQECQTQTQDVREEILDVKYDATTRLRKLRIHSNKTNESQEPLGWTTWEQYNFILLGMVNEFVELGASIDIKLTILQLWAAYLKKLEVAFTSTKQQKVPKLAKKYNKRDAEIIYGKIAERKKKQRRRTGSHTSASSSVSGLQSEDNSTRMMNQQKKRMIAAEYERYVNESSEGEEASVMNQSLYSVQSSTGRSSNRSELRFRFNKAAKKESDKIRRMSMKLPRQIREKFRETYRRSVFCDGPQIMTPMQLWSLIYLALRIHDENIQLGDMLRWAREGHLSYYRLDNLLPPEVTLTRKEVNMLYQRGEIKHKGLRRSIGNLARFLDVWETKKPDLMTLIERYCTELQLPKGIASYAERMMALSPPRMLFNDKTTWFPNYEGRAMAFIVVVLKILFALDGVTEYEISRVVERINKAARAKGLTRSKLFSFCEWQRYIECRRNLLTNVHYPTKLKRASDTPGNSHLFLNYFNAIKARSSHREEPEITSYHHLMPRDLTDAMKNIFEKLDETASPAQKEVEIFPASLTPQYSYLQRMLEHPEKDLPSVLHANFRAMKIGYITEPKTLETLAAHCNINLRIVDAGLHFFDKVIPPYQQPRLPTIQEYNERVQIEQPIKTGTHSEAEVCNDLEEYLHRKGPFVLHIDPSKRDEYMGVFEASEKRRSNSMNNSFDFCFDEVLPNGKLLVINDESSRPVTAIETGNDFETGSNNEPHRIMDFLEKCNFRMSRFEKSTLITTLEGKSIQPRLRKPKPETRRDPSTGKFVRAEASVHEKAAEDTPFRKSNEKISSSMNKKLDEGEANEKDEPDDGKPMRCNGLDSSYNFGLIDDDISVLDETSSESSVENLGENDLPSEKDETETLFRPYTDYWLLRCIFSQTHQANFQDVLKMLPYNFRWLLEECSSIVEMSEEDLYEEIHLVESYFSDVLTPKQNPPASNSYERQEYRSRSHCNYIRKKW